MSLSLSKISYSLVTLLILLSAFAYKEWREKNSAHSFTYDAMGYYIYLPAFFIYDDLEHFKFLDEIIPKYEIWGDYRPEPLPNGKVLDKYALGQALFESPWFLVAHATAPLLGYTPDGFSPPYNLFVSLGNILVGLVALWYLRRILLRYFPDTAVAISLLLLLVATNYWCYIGYNAPMSHASLFALYVFLLWHSIKWHEKPTWFSSLAIGASVGFAMLMRPTDVVCVLVPLLWGVGQRGWRGQLALLAKHWPKLGAAAVVGVCFISLQLMYWKIATDSWVYYSYGDQRLDLFKAHIAQVLYGYRKGWLVYTPIMLLSLIGFVPLYRQNRPAFWAILAFFVVNFYLVASWSVWWYGGSFGQRALVQSYAFLLFPFTAFWTWAGQANVWLRSLLAGFVALCIWLNTTQTFCPILDGENNTRTYFWHVFGKTSVSLDDRKYLQIDEKRRATKHDRLVPLYNTRFDRNDTLFAPSGMLVNNPMNPPDSLCAQQATAPLCSPVLAIDTAHRNSPQIVLPLAPEYRKGWLRFSFNTGYMRKEWNFWHQHVFGVSFWHNNTKVKAVQLRPATLVNLWQWTPVTFETQIPANKDVTHVKIHIGGEQTPHTLFIDDLQVQHVSP